MLSPRQGLYPRAGGFHMDRVDIDAHTSASACHAAATDEPEPQNGSSIRPPSGQKALTRGRSVFHAFSVGCRRFPE